jgi:trehalose/maltose transport system substrate-binding protein
MPFALGSKRKDCSCSPAASLGHPLPRPGAARPEPTALKVILWAVLRDLESVCILFAIVKSRQVEDSRLNITGSANRKTPAHRSRSSSLKLLGNLGIVLLFYGLGCSKKPSNEPAPPEPVTVSFLDVEWEAPDRLPGLGQDLQDFTRETGIQVKRLPGPDGSLNQLALWRDLLQKGSATPDVYGIDVIWAGILSPYLMDLKPYFAADLSSESPVVVANYTVGDKLVAMPRHAYIGALFYRTDLLQRYGYRAPPKTWGELETMARRIQAGERAKGEKNFWGFVWQGAPGEDLTCDGLEWQIGDGAGRIIEDDKTISVNNPETIRAWQRAARWVGTISPPGITAYSKWDGENVWSSGNTAFLRSWVSDYSLIHLNNPPGKATGFGVTSVPGGREGRAGALGGNGLAVSRSSAHPREALELIRFLRQRDAQFLRATRHSEPRKGLELYELPGVLQMYPQLVKVRQNGGGIVARPSIAAGQKYEEVTRAYIQTLHSVLTGEKIPSEAAAALEKELEAITGFQRGPPARWVAAP